MPFIDGKWIHHNDCYWCVNHQEIPLEIKKGRTVRVREHCGRHDRPIPLPGQPGRHCEDYIQKNCECIICIPFVIQD